MNLVRRITQYLTIVFGLYVTSVALADYSPQPAGKYTVQTILDLEVEDESRQRSLPLRAILPDSAPKPYAVILYSHGLGGSRMNNTYLGEYWASHGFVVVYLQHPGSDESVWKDAPKWKWKRLLNKAANAKNAVNRYLDVKVILNQLEKWNEQSDHSLFQALDLQRLGMSGHSFGANTTQAVSGQQFPQQKLNFTDERIDAALAFSPNAPAHSRDLKAVFGGVKIPWLLMTGTQDEVPVGNATVSSRLAVYPALPTGDKYELVFHEGKHHAFSDSRRKQRNPNHHPAILAISLAYWQAYLNGNEDAKAWLQSDRVRRILES